MDNLNIAVYVNEVVHDCHKASRDAGWWHDTQGNSILDNPLVVSNKLLLIISEIVEAMEGDRTNCMDDKLPHRKAIEVELADGLIRIADLAGALGMDLGGAVLEKMQYNQNRLDHKQEARSSTNGKKY
jgi:NTP pyrophosphatase (non-canonical NTP hydrolase)